VGYGDLYEGDYEAKAYMFHKPRSGLEFDHKEKIIYTEVRPDALYFTRCQAERGSSANQAGYPKVNLNNLETEFFSRAIVMHPLPRLDEVSVLLDDHPRSRYFKQAANGVPIRMALICLMLGLKPWSSVATL
jgi:aspartate carbamoyltransferase catalytic subunit